MFQNIISGLILILIIILGFAAYIVLFEIQEIKSPSLVLNLEQFKIDKEIQTEQFNKTLKAPFENSIKQQLEWIKDHDNMSVKYDNILRDIADKHKIVYMEEYAKDIAKKQAELEKGFSEFKGNLRAETEKSLQYYTHLIEKEIEKSVANLTIQYGNEFEEYKGEIQQEKSNELLNYRLKLKVLDLSGEKAQEYREEIEKIENDKKAKLNSKLSGLNYELKIKTEELKQEKNEKYAALKENLIKKEEQKISERNDYIQETLDAYENNRRDLLGQKVDAFEEEIQDISYSIENNKKEITQIVTEDLEFLQNQYLNFAEGE